MKDPVRVRTSNCEMTVEREYAEVFELEILDEPVIAHGRLRGVTRRNGRPVKPKANLPKATHKPTSTSAGGESGGVAADTNKE